MHRIATVICLLCTLFFFALSAPRAQAQEPKGKDGKEKAAAPQAQASPSPETPKPASPPAPSPSVTLDSLDRDLKHAIGLLLVVFVVGTTLVWLVMAGKISGRAGTNDLQPLATTAQLQPLATTAQLQPLATTAQLQPLATTAQLQPLATTQQVHDAQTALEARVDALRADITRLSQDVALVKGSNDSVLNLIGRLVPGLPPQIVSLVPSSAAVGTGVVILGNNFLNGCRVWFGTAEVQPTQVTDTAIRLNVPSGVTGELNVYVQGQNGVSTPLRFTVV